MSIVCFKFVKKILIFVKFDYIINTENFLNGLSAYII